MPNPSTITRKQVILRRMPWPPMSANQALRMGNVHKAARLKKQYLEDFRAAMLAAGVVYSQQRPTFPNGPVDVSLWMYAPRANMDADNYLKWVYDALQACGVVGNDNQFVDRHVYQRTDPDKRGFVTVFVGPVPSERKEPE